VGISALARGSGVEVGERRVVLVADGYGVRDIGLVGPRAGALAAVPLEVSMRSSWSLQGDQLNSPVASGVSLAGSGLGGGDRGQTGGQGEESKALDGGRHAGRFAFWVGRNGVRVLGKLSWKRRARVIEMRSSHRAYIYALHPLAQQNLPNSPSSSQGEMILGLSGSINPCLHINDTRSGACLSTRLGLRQWKPIGPRRVNPDLDGLGDGLGSSPRCTDMPSVESFEMTRFCKCLRHGVVTD
jgi:hypothetical protein